MDDKKNGQPSIPKLELEKFIFSPPGPMGWSFSEYEHMLEDPANIVLNETAVQKKLSDLSQSEIAEWPVTGKKEAAVPNCRPMNEGAADESKDEVQQHENKAELTAGTLAENESEQLIVKPEEEAVDIEQEQPEADDIEQEQPEADDIENGESEEENQPQGPEKPEKKGPKIRIVLPSTPVKGPWIGYVRD